MPVFREPPPPPQAATAGGYAGAQPYAPTTVAYDPTPDQVDRNQFEGDPYTINYAAQQAANPAMAPNVGTSWEATPEQVEEARRVQEQTGKLSGGWFADKRDFTYGRNPYQADADVERARQMGAGAAQQGFSQGQAAQQYATDQAFGTYLTAADAGAYGRQAAEGVAAAGQNVNQVGQTGGTALQRLGSVQALTGQGLNNSLTQQGAGNQATLTQQGGNIASGINQVGLSAARGTAPTTNALNDVASRATATGVTRANEMTAVGQDYANRLSSLEQNEGPSGAQGLLNQQNNRAMNTQLALARSGRGAGGNAAAIQQAGANIGAIQQDAGNQASQLRAQEYAAWRQRQASNIGAAASTNLGARQAGGALEQQAYGLGANAYQAAGNLNLAGVQTQLQGATQAGQIAQQGALSGASLAQANAQAGANALQTGMGQAAQTYGQGVGYQMQGAEANTAAQATAAGIGQNAYGQEIGGYNAAAQTGLQGYGMGIDAANQGVANQLAFEGQGYGVRDKEMQGGLALEDKYIRDYAITAGGQAAEQAARAQERAGIYSAVATGVAAVA